METIYIMYPLRKNFEPAVFKVEEEILDFSAFFDHLKNDFPDACQFLVLIPGGKS